MGAETAIIAATLATTAGSVYAAQQASSGPGDPPTRSSKQISRAMERERRRRAQAFGAANTILGPTGDRGGGGSIGTKSLLGQ